MSDTEEHESISLKLERGRGRQRSLTLSKKRRGKRRSGSEDGKLKIGNTRTVGFCSYCRPSLANRILKKRLVDIHYKADLHNAMADMKNDRCLKSSHNFLQDRIDEKQVDTYAPPYSLYSKHLEQAVYNALWHTKKKNTNAAAASATSASSSSFVKPLVNKKEEEQDEESVLTTCSSLKSFFWVNHEDADLDIECCGIIDDVSIESDASDLTESSFSSWEEGEI